MNEKYIIQTALVLTIAVCGLFGYVIWQWPDEVNQLDIPKGKVMRIPGTNLKGICTQGDPNGMSVWYRVTPFTASEVAQQEAMLEVMKNFKWPENK